MASTRKSNTSKKNGNVLGDLDGQLREIIERVEKEGKGLEKRLKTSDLYKRAQKLQKDFTKQAKTVRTQAFHAAGLATKSDLDRLNRKLNTLNKKVGSAA